MGLSPRTTEVQFDEKWSFVAKEEANCNRSDPSDDGKGDCWDHVALDPEHKLVAAAVPGRRAAENTEALVAEFRHRTGGRRMNLMTSDGYPAYKVAPAGLTYATVTKRREKGRVAEVGVRIIFGRSPRGCWRWGCRR